MKNRKIYCLNNISKVGLAELRENYSLTENLEEAHGILVRSAEMKDMTFPKSLRAIGRAGVGVNNIPLEKCAELGIVVFNSPGANANAVKELVICGLMLASRDIVGGANFILTNLKTEGIAKLAEKEKKNYAGCEIKGKKLGVIGLGAIGAEVANTAIALGMKVYGYDPYISVNAAWRLDRAVVHINDVNEIYKNCDYITIHVPLLDSTKGMLNTQAFASMKKGVKVLNFARDLLVDEIALKNALEDGTVSKYVTDFPNENVCNMKNVLILPHLGASTEEAEDNSAVMAVEEIMDYLDNGNIRNSVNFPQLDAGICGSESRIALLHKNVPNMLGQITAIVGESKINIDNLTNKAKDKYAYTLLDVEQKIDDGTLDKFKAIDGMIRVRVVK